MNTTETINVTDGRMKRAINKRVTPIIQKEANEIVQKELNNCLVRFGKITKFYPYLDKAEVKLNNSKTTVLCRILHRCGGDLIDLYTPLAHERIFDDKRKEVAIIPKAAQEVCVLRIHDEDSVENLILGYHSNKDLVGFNPADPGNIKLMSLNETNPYWIKFGVDGLKFRLPSIPEFLKGQLPSEMEDVTLADFSNVYTKDEMDTKLKENEDNISFADLLNVTDNYKQTSEDKYYLFRGDCWTINNNFESSAAITSESNSDFTVTGTFRTKNDLIGLYWNSQDPITHPYISYGNRSDYTDVTLDFDYVMTGCKDFSDGIISITIAKNNGAVYYFTMNRFINNGHVSIDFNNLTLLAGNTYINAKGQSVTVSEETPVKVTDIKYIMFVIVPTNFVENNEEYTIMANADFKCEISNITVSYGEICKEHLPLEPHQYRLCEGYDDFYNLNPYRICKEMRKLGYTEWCDLYIGASHFYEKSGTVGDVIDATSFEHSRTEKMVLNKNVPLNKAFTAWLDCYSRELKANDCKNLVVSVSMENLQCPTSWRQKDVNGNYAITGWVPSTFFYSPCNDEVAPYMQKVSEACLDIVVDNCLQPILQMGEAWWWWNENDRPNQPPCFYDAATKEKYLEEFGKTIPEYSNSWSNFDERTMYWLNKQLCGYSDKLRDVVKDDKYTDGLYMALFFPPSVLDKERVPEMMRKVNYLEEAYHPSKLDVLQLEDYDWVIEDSIHHNEVYSLGQKLGFKEEQLHYFGGFVQYPKDAVKFWKLIVTSMDTAMEKGFKETFVWAGSQVRRDQKILGYESYEVVQKLINQ